MLAIVQVARRVGVGKGRKGRNTLWVAGCYLTVHSSQPHHLLPLNQNHDAKLLLAVFPPRAVLPKRRRGKIAEDDGAEEEGEEDEDHLRREEHVLRRVLPRDEAAGVVAEVLQEQQIRKTH